MTTDRLLYPIEGEEKLHDVLLVMRVKLKVIDMSTAPYEFLGQ